MKIKLYSILACSILLAMFIPFAQGISSERKQGQGTQNSGTARPAVSSEPTVDCTGDIDSRTTAPSREVSVPGEEVIRIAPNQRGQRLSREAISRIPPQAIARMNELSKNSNRIINSRRAIAQQVGNEIIFENRAVEVQTLTPDGILSCESIDNFLDQIVDDSEGLTFIGGPLDNQ